MPNLELNGKFYTVNALLAEDSFDLQPRILPVLPDFLQLYLLFYDSFSEMVTRAEKSAGEIERDEIVDKMREIADKAQPIILRLCKALPPDELRTIRRTLLRGATCDGKALYNEGVGPNNIDLLMQGRTIDMWRLLLFALGVSYPDFFEIADVAKRAVGKAAAEPDSKE